MEWMLPLCWVGQSYNKLSGLHTDQAGPYGSLDGSGTWTRCLRLRIHNRRIHCENPPLCKLRCLETNINSFTAGAAYIRVFIFYLHIKYHLLNMLKIKCDINQQYLERIDLHFVKSE